VVAVDPLWERDSPNICAWKWIGLYSARVFSYGPDGKQASTCENIDHSPCHIHWLLAGIAVWSAVYDTWPEVKIDRMSV